LFGFFQITIACRHKLIAKHLAKYIDISKKKKIATLKKFIFSPLCYHFQVSNEMVNPKPE